MDPQLGIELFKVAVATVGGLVVAGYWRRRKDRFDRYQYLDKSYNRILYLYFSNPRFGQPELAADYVGAFSDQVWKYHYFAMRVHTFLESIFDLGIPREWKQIYRHHAKLHAAWLRDHRDLHEPGYVSDVLEATPAGRAVR